jgi:acyl-CoA synthetase (AMP-forming)/AMP-acid ligase II
MAVVDTNPTVAGMLAAIVERTPDAAAVIERDGDQVRALTFAELAAAVSHTAATLSERGLKRGDVVGVWLPNWTESLVWEFALAAVGAANLGINTRYSVHELGHLLQRGRPVGLVVPARFLELDFAGRLHAAVSETPPGGTVPWVAAVRATGENSEELDAGGGVWSTAPLELAARGDESFEPAGRPDDIVNCFTTSGSTGMPKLAGHDQRGVATHCRNVGAAFDMRSGDCFLGVLPLSGVFGFNPAMAMIASGGTLLLEPVFEAGAVVADMERFGVTHAVGGDDMLGRVMDAWTDAPSALERFRRGGIADFAGRAAAVVEWAERDLDARISGVYGSSELFSLTAVWPASDSLEQRIRGGGAVVSADIAVRTVDPESGEPCAPGAIGELQFRGYNVVQEYLGDPAASATAFTDDGWFRSGDLGSLAGRPGEFVYVCRAGDALRLRGFLVEPAEIEQFLQSHAEVALAKVVGVSAEGGADVAVGYVQLVEGASLDSGALLAWSRERLAPFKVPSYLNIIDEFPVTTGTNGTKIRTAELRRLAAEQVGSHPKGGR